MVKRREGQPGRVLRSWRATTVLEQMSDIYKIEATIKGLDPGERNRFHNLLADVAEDVIIILSTHIVDDVTELCSNMAIMNTGKMVYKGTPQAVISELNGKVWQKMWIFYYC